MKAFQGTFFLTDLELDSVHLAKPALCNFSPLRLKIISPEVPELPVESVSAFHEYTEPLRKLWQTASNPMNGLGSLSSRSRLTSISTGKKQRLVEVDSHSNL